MNSMMNMSTIVPVMLTASDFPQSTSRALISRICASIATRTCCREIPRFVSTQRSGRSVKRSQ